MNWSYQSGRVLGFQSLLVFFRITFVLVGFHPARSAALSAEPVVAVTSGQNQEDLGVHCYLM